MVLFETYEHLVANFPEDCTHLFGAVVEEKNGLWFAVNKQGYPHLLIESEPTRSEADLMLKYIDVEFARDCEIDIGLNGSKLGCYTVVRLNDDDTDFIRIFLRLIEENFLLGEAQNNSISIRNIILTMVDLFSQMDTNNNDVVGLWGELHLIHQAEDVTRAVKSWCLAKNAKYDFVSSNFVLEVKTTLKSNRQHRFSLEQLRSAGDVDLFVASILLVEIQSGHTIGEVVNKICDVIIDPEDRQSFFKQCLIKGGKDVYRSELRLAVFPDKNPISIYRAENIPVPDIDPSDFISRVRFDVDLTNVDEVEDAVRQKMLCFEFL